jgi:hypothetical protein
MYTPNPPYEPEVLEVRSRPLQCKHTSGLNFAQKNNLTGPYVVGWFLGGQKSTRLVRYFSRYFYRVFELPSPRNAQKRDKQIEKKSVLDFLVDFFVKLFDTIFLQNIFCNVFELSSLRNT